MRACRLRPEAGYFDDLGARFGRRRGRAPTDPRRRRPQQPRRDTTPGPGASSHGAQSRRLASSASVASTTSSGGGSAVSKAAQSGESAELVELRGRKRPPGVGRRRGIRLELARKLPRNRLRRPRATAARSRSSASKKRGPERSKRRACSSSCLSIGPRAIIGNPGKLAPDREPVGASGDPRRRGRPQP